MKLHLPCRTRKGVHSFSRGSRDKSLDSPFITPLRPARTPRRSPVPASLRRAWQVHVVQGLSVRFSGFLVVATALGMVSNLCISTFCLAESSSPHRRIPAPSGAYLLEIDDQIRVTDPNGLNLLTLAGSLEGVQSVEAKWSPDSQRVVVVINYGRGSGVEAAYFDGAGWHKTLQPDSDLPVNELARQGGASGRLAAQHCRLGDWLDGQRIAVTGELVFSSQKHVPYGYTLIFTGAPTHLDPGGFEEGAIEGVGYHLR